MTIGKRIKELRKQRNMSIDDLAFKLGKNRTTVYRYENGDIENLPLDILDPLAKALDTTPAYIMGWNTDEVKTVRVLEGGEEFLYKSLDEKGVKQAEIWYEEFGLNAFTEEEFAKIIEYARFLVYLRGDKKDV